jgi:acyl carrier protein phosphodiesterase
MNYLSHLYFSQRTPESMTGNLMGDFKPNAVLRQQLPTPIRLGIENHRLVDRLTDKYQPVKELRPLFSSEYRRYAGIILDIAFDYFLIKHWQVEQDGHFEEFTQICYEGLAQCRHWMPPRMAYVTTKMDEHDWLSHYATLEGIGDTINQVSKRLRFANNLAGGVVEVEKNYQEIEQVYHQLIDYLNEKLAAASPETPTLSN